MNSNTPTPKTIIHETHYREHTLNRRFLNWCMNSNTHPEDENAFKGFINWFCEFYNYNGGVEMFTGFKERRYFKFKKIYLIG